MQGSFFGKFEFWGSLGPKVLILEGPIIWVVGVETGLYFRKYIFVVKEVSYGV